MRAAVILHVPRSAYSSVVIAYEDLGARLRARGHELRIFGPDELGARVNARLLPLVLPFLVRRWVRKQPDLDLVVFHSYAGWLARPRRSLRTIVAFHGFEPLFHEAHEAEVRRAGGRLSRRYRIMYGLLMPRMLRVACRHADKIICLNGDERAALIDRGYAPASRVWQDRGTPPDWFFQPHDYRPRATTIAVVMQWLNTKGVRYLVDAFATLARRHPDLRLVAAGTLQSADVVRASFPPDVRHRVDVHPTFDRRAHAHQLAAADVFLHTSVYEAFSMAIVEAMASGLPIVTTRSGVAIDYLVHGRDALIIPVGDAAAIVSAIEPLLDDRARREALGQAAQRQAQSFDANVTGDPFVAMLEQLVAVS